MNLKYKVPLFLLLLFSLINSVHAVSEPSLLICDYDNLNKEIVCTWNSCPAFPWTSQQICPVDIKTANPSASCVVMNNKGVWYCFGGGSYSFSDYFGNSLASDYCPSGSHAYNGYVWDAGGYQQGVNMTYAGLGYYSANVSALVSSNIDNYMMVQCDAGTGLYRNQVEVPTTSSTVYHPSSTYGGSNGSGMFEFTSGSIGRFFLSISGYTSAISGGYVKVNDGTVYNIFKASNNPIKNANYDITSFTNLGGLVNVYETKYLPNVSAVHQYIVQFVNPSYKSVSLVSYYSLSPSLSCSYAVPIGGSCTNDCNCTAVFGSPTSCVNNVCVVKAGSPCNNTSQCETGATCISNVCRLSSQQSCTSNYQCAGGLCYNKDVLTGIGSCAPTCVVDSDCGSLSKCKNLGKGVSPFTYCTAPALYNCYDGDRCYSGNCVPECGTSTYSRCTASGYGCWCSNDLECTSPEKCISVDIPNDPIGSSPVCVSSGNTGDVCTSNVDCGSNNCQNGVCCGPGLACCSQDSQCPFGRVCFSNTGWYGTALYSSCWDKRSSGSHCLENKECGTGNCSSGVCQGLQIQTTGSYTVTPGYVIGCTTCPGTGVNASIKFNYKLLNGSSVPEPTTCGLYLSSDIYNPILSGSCNQTFQINYQYPGEYEYFMWARSANHLTIVGNEIKIEIQSSKSNLGLGTICNSSTECLSGRCQQVKGVKTEQTCYWNKDCAFTEGYTCTAQMTAGNCNYETDCSAGYLCRDEVCKNQGYCGRNAYKICCATDGYTCCDYNEVGADANYEQCPSSNVLLCNPGTFTCNKQKKQNGVECSSNMECVSQYCGKTQTNVSKSVCCTGNIQSDYCCNTGSDCFSSNVCYETVYKCSTGSGGGTGQCSTNDECISGGSGLEGNFDQYCAIVGTNTVGKCYPNNCKTSESSCTYCYNTETGGDNKINYSYTTTKACHAVNKTMNILCLPSSMDCQLTGGTTPTQAPVSPKTSSINPELLFNQLINLAFYTFVVAILFMIIALVVAGMHLAYGLIKR